MAHELKSIGVKARCQLTCFSGLHLEMEQISLECHKPQWQLALEELEEVSEGNTARGEDRRS